MSGVTSPRSQQPQKPRVLYITSRGHSGSSVLSLLTSGHSQVVSAGELKMLTNPDPERRLCSCHRLVPDQCPFWGAVQKRVLAAVGRPLDQLVLGDNGDDSSFLADNEALYAAITAVSGAALIVDSSKSLPRLSRLLTAEAHGAAFTIHTVHLHRGPFGSMNSARKKGDQLRQAAYTYNRMFFLSRELLRGRKALRVYYERLASSRRAEMARLMGWLHLPLEESQFQWREGIRRDIHGNAMRFKKSDQICLDQSWRRQLTSDQKLAVLLWTLPVRFRSALLFRLMGPLIKRGVNVFSRFVDGVHK